MHIHPIKPSLIHRFCCNSCGAVVGEHENEQEALAIARKNADLYRWVWFHPSWGLTCPQCQEYRQWQIERQSHDR